MNKTNLSILALLIILCSSCYSYKIYPKNFKIPEKNSENSKAYVVNDSLKKELKILTTSKLFEIVSDSSKADLNIKLYPLEKSYVCGQPLTASMLTIGQLPVYLPDRYFYRFDEIKNSNITERKMELKIAKRVWFWDLFVFNKKFEEKAGKVVFVEYKQSKK